MKTEKQFASGAKGPLFESGRAYHPLLQNQQHTNGIGSGIRPLTDCQTPKSNFSDQRLTSQTALGQTVTHRHSCHGYTRAWARPEVRV